MASYLDARATAAAGCCASRIWIARAKLPDRRRPSSSTLEAFGFEWDGEIVRQSDRTAHYAAALDALRARGLTFECSCSRSKLAEEDRYPGTCRERPLLPGVPTATRLRVDPGHVQFADRIQGIYRQDVAAAVGDVILKRRDRVFAYVLAVVVDDAAQGVTHVVRGADLLDNTPRQIYLQRAARAADSPSYAHVPVLVEADGGKLAKSARSVRLERRVALPQLLSSLRALGPGTAAGPRERPRSPQHGPGRSERWDIKRVPRRLRCALTACL